MPEAYSKHAPGAVFFLIWSWAIFDLKSSFKLLMIKDHHYSPGAYGPGPVLGHMSRPKTPKSKGERIDTADKSQTMTR